MTERDLGTLVRRRVEGTFEVDPWGLDIDLVTLLAPLAMLRWRISVEGDELIPVEGPAVLVAPRRLVAPLAQATVIVNAVLQSTGRIVRTLGIPDVAPIGPVLRRLGGAVDHPAEAAALLRAGHLVLSHREVSADAPTIQVHCSGWELGRRWRVRFE